MRNIEDYARELIEWFRPNQANMIAAHDEQKELAEQSRQRQKGKGKGKSKGKRSVAVVSFQKSHHAGALPGVSLTRLIQRSKRFDCQGKPMAESLLIVCVV